MAAVSSTLPLRMNEVLSVLSIYPAEGSEEMNVGWCSFPRFVWKPEKDHAPGWSNVFRGTSYRDSEKLLRAFLKKYRLTKMPDNQDRHGRLWGRSELLHGTPGGVVSIRSGRYLSHRRGYRPGYVEMQLDDYACHSLRFRFRGTIEEARRVFSSGEFKADLEDIIHGQEHVIPAAHGVWSSFCKTQFANDPRRVGLPTDRRGLQSTDREVRCPGLCGKIPPTGAFVCDRRHFALRKR